MIQKVIIIGTVVLIAAVAMSTRTSSDSHSTASLDEAIMRAESENKFILVDFYAKWCGPCKQFNAESKSDTDMVTALQDVVLLKVDCETPEGRRMARKYKVKGYPTFVVMTEDGSIESRWTGYAKEHFLANFDAAVYE